MASRLIWWSAINRDGRPDLAYTAREEPLSIRLQTEDGEWSDAIEFEGFEALGWIGTMAVHDLDGDGFVELLVLEANAIRIYSLDTQGDIVESEVYFISGENPFNLTVEDFTGDGRPDLLYLNNDGQQSIALRAQLGEWWFGPEMREIVGATGADARFDA